MIKDFFVKKENIFILIIAIISIFFVILGFSFLFLKPDYSDGPKKIPNTLADIEWKDYSSELLDQKILYPSYMYVAEQKDESGVGLTIAEFEPQDFLTYFSNQNHISIYPSGIDAPFFYGKIKETPYTSSTGQEFTRSEYLTTDNKVWAVKLVPEEPLKGGQPWGFIWIQSKILKRQDLCMSAGNIIIDSMNCDPYNNEKTVYEGDVTDNFIRLGYEIVNKNTFK